MQKVTNSKTDLLLVSFVALFLELVVIRWLASEVRIFAYFKNVPLFAAFLGLGAGFIIAPSRKLFDSCPFSCKAGTRAEMQMPEKLTTG